MNETCHVSGWGDYRHLYGDCSKRINLEKDYKMIKFSAYLMGCHSRCEQCIERRKQKIEEKLEKKRMSDIKNLEGKIKELEKALELLKSGNRTINVRQFDFRRDVEEEIRADVINELERDSDPSALWRRP